jgi:hypothetical protein
MDVRLYDRSKDKNICSDQKAQEKQPAMQIWMCRALIWRGESAFQDRYAQI